MATTSISSPLEVTFELNDPSILEDLKRTLKLIRGVGKISVRAVKKEKKQVYEYPNEETLEAIAEAKSGGYAGTIDMTNFDSFMNSINEIPSNNCVIAQRPRRI